MRTQHILSSHRIFMIVILLIFLLTTVGCGNAPTLVAAATAKPLPAAKVTLSQSQPVVQGTDVAMVISVDPYEELNWVWNISGTSGGKLNSTTGENVVYTAGKPGTDIIEAKGTTAEGRTMKLSASIQVVPAERPATAPTQPAEEAQTTAPTKTPQPSATPVEMITLTGIANEDEVPCLNLAKGQYPLNLKEEIWPIIFVAGRFHPQEYGGKAARKINGTWSQNIRFGDCGKPGTNIGERFELLIITTDEQANAAIEKYIADSNARNSWPGLTELPQGITTHVDIMVTRK